jgi:hypothetical protein
MKRILICITLFFTLVPASASAKTPAKGVYLNCKGDLTYCQPHINRLMNVGVRVFIMPQGGQARAIHDYIFQRGGSIYWHATYMAETGIANKTIWPGTIGFYISDEPGLYHKGGEVRWWHHRVRELTTKPTLIVHWGCDRQAVKQAVWPYIDAAEIHGNDCYPITSGLKAQKFLGRVLFKSWSQMARISRTRQQSSMAVGKAFSWSDLPKEDPTQGTDRFPSWSEFHAMAKAARRSGVQTLVWWGYDVWKDRPDAETRWAAFNGAFA